MAASSQPRSRHLTDEITHRDLFGCVRGACTACNACGQYIKRTSEYTLSPAAFDGRKPHPDNDITVTHCSRCSCPPEAHAVRLDEQKREEGNDAFALGHWDEAIRHYTAALAAAPASAVLFSNRSAAYAAKGWGAQAAVDADRALALRPDWARAWGRRGVALLLLRRPAEALEAFQRGQKLEPGNATLEQGAKDARRALEDAQRQHQQGRQHEQLHSAPPQPQRPPVAASPGAGQPAVAAPACPAQLESLLDLFRCLQAKHQAVAEAVRGLEQEMVCFAAALRVAVAAELAADAAHATSSGMGASGLDVMQAATSSDMGASDMDAMQAAASSDMSASDMDAMRAAVSYHTGASGDGALAELQTLEALESQHPSVAGPAEQGTPASRSLDGHATDGDGGTEDGDVASIAASGASSAPAVCHAAGDEQGGGVEPGGSSSAASNSSPVSPATSDDDDWLSAVQQARARLATSGVPKRQPARRGAATSAAPAPARPGVGLSDLHGMLQRAAPALCRDAQGVARAACKCCGVQRCAAFRPAGLTLGPEEAAALFSGGPVAGTDTATLHREASTCAACGCDAVLHETEKEAVAREARLRRQRERQERARQQRAATQCATHPPLPVEPLEARRERMQAAVQRRADAEAAGEQLQETDADVLTHSRRTACAGCSDCPGFRILYRPQDANDPAVMFFCSLCGCPASSHEVDGAWAREEARRRAAEAAAEARRREASAATASMQAAGRAEEASAFVLLGLSPAADARSVARAYKRLALKFHPDKTAPGDDAAAKAEHFHKLTAAYKLLTAGRSTI